MIKKVLRPILQIVPPNIKKNIVAIIPSSVWDWYIKKSTDVYLLSYPKCGRTWLRLMLAKALQLHYNLPEDIIFEISSFTSLNPNIPRITIDHDGAPLSERPQEVRTVKSRFQHKKVILLIRNPRDVVVSSYFQMTKRDKKYEGDISSYLRYEVGSLDTLITWYNIWAQSRHIPSDTLFVRYEDLHENSEQELRKILNFLELPDISPLTILKAVEYAHFDNMRNLEANDTFQSSRLRPGQQDDSESYKTRRGKVGGYIDYLSEADIEYVDKKYWKSCQIFSVTTNN